jgi:hypothetical protein
VDKYDSLWGKADLHPKKEKPQGLPTVSLPYSYWLLSTKNERGERARRALSLVIPRKTAENPQGSLSFDWYSPNHLD